MCAYRFLMGNLSTCPFHYGSIQSFAIYRRKRGREWKKNRQKWKRLVVERHYLHFRMLKVIKSNQVILIVPKIKTYRFFFVSSSSCRIIWDVSWTNFVCNWSFLCMYNMNGGKDYLALCTNTRRMEYGNNNNENLMLLFNE